MFVLANAGGHDFRKQRTLFKLRERLVWFTFPYFVAFGNTIFVDEYDVLVEPLRCVSTLLDNPLSQRNTFSSFGNRNSIKYFISAELQVIHVDK